MFRALWERDRLPREVVKVQGGARGGGVHAEGGGEEGGRKLINNLLKLLFFAKEYLFA